MMRRKEKEKKLKKKHYFYAPYSMLSCSMLSCKIFSSCAAALFPVFYYVDKKEKKMRERK